MTTYARRLAVAASALAAVTALGACNDEPEPSFADPTPSDPTTSATDDEPTAPELPAAAKENNQAGAVAFANYWWDVADFAQATGKTAPLRDISAPTCEACSGAIAYVDGIYRRHGEVRGGESEIEVTKVDAISSGDEQAFYVRFSNHNTRQRITYPNKPPTVFKASTTTGRFVVHWVDGSWRVDVWEVT